MTSSKRVGILCGGGPAPGINSVIGAATIRSVLGGADVLGIHDGFRRLMQGDSDCATPLTIEDASRTHFTGGSQLGTSRANPTRDSSQMLPRAAMTSGWSPKIDCACVATDRAAT